jgi:hypothetical protein
MVSIAKPRPERIRGTTEEGEQTPQRSSAKNTQRSGDRETRVVAGVPTGCFFVAGNERTQPDVLHLLAQDQDAEVRESVAWREQVREVAKGDVRGQVTLIARLFGVAE